MISSERFDGTLLHAYGYLEGRTSHTRPDIRSRLIEAAGRELQSRGLVNNFVVSGRTLGGRSEPLSEVIIGDFRRKAHIGPENTYVNPTAITSTRAELVSLREEAKKHKWTNLLSISWGVHKPRIEILARKIFRRGIFRKTKMRVTMLSAEEILTTLPEPRNRQRYARVIEGVHNSEGERKFEAYERKARLLSQIPFVPQLIDFVPTHYKPKAF